MGKQSLTRSKDGETELTGCPEVPLEAAGQKEEGGPRLSLLPSLYLSYSSCQADTSQDEERVSKVP